MHQQKNTQLGIKENGAQFSLLVLINAFVGSMVGLERAVIPEFAQTVFGLSKYSAVFSFILAFGLAKSAANLLMGRLSTRFTRKQLLTAGWLFALPVPWLLLYAPNWGWVIAANIFLGFNQGLAWSSTIVMKLDLVGERFRGLAMGINEFAGYLAVGLMAFLAGYIATTTGEIRYAFAPGIFFSIAGLLLTYFFVRDTRAHVRTEASQTDLPPSRQIWKDTTWRHPNLGSVSLGGFVNNLNDGILWGLLPILLAARGYTLAQIGFLAGIYPAVWGIGQLVTGKLGDMVSRKYLVSAGLVLKGLALALLVSSGSYPLMITALVLLGIGTALVYPNFLAVVAENTHPDQRALSIGIFRFWRDFGYVAGAVIAGICSDLFGFEPVLTGTVVLTVAAGLFAAYRMKKNLAFSG